jgi:elongation factor 1-gamma
MSSYKIYGEKNNQLFKAQIAANYNDVKLDIQPISAENLKKSAVGKGPILESAEGVLFEANAIARYIARLGKARLYGSSLLEGALIEQWIEFAVHEIELPANVWTFPLLGKIPHNPIAVNRAQGDIQKALGILDKHLLSHVYLVGHRPSIADIIVSMTLYYVYQLVLDPSARESYVNVNRWYVGLVNQPEFKAVLGETKLCEKVASQEVAKEEKKEQKPKEDKTKEDKKPKEQKPKEEKTKEDKPKKEQKPKEEKPKEDKPKEKKEQKPKEEKPKEEKSKKKQKEEEAEEEEEEEKYEDEKPKGKNPLDLLPKSTFVLDEWKRTYSNTDTRTEAIPWFWKNFDPQGYSIWTGDFKYNSENEILFKTCNLVGGFIQRLENLRKYGFGTLLIFGEQPPFEISVMFVFRGQDMPAEMIECGDSELYNWRKLDPNDPKHREYINDFWAWDGQFELKEGVKKFNQGKTFK